ncbi:MAG: hypothetical protein KAU21_21595, partial [Gammaproteobacteria bacterium]|nr:hypothetical protein [Gammaproteobacteria bacterium]
MGDSILVTPGANSASQQTKLTPLDTTDNTGTSDNLDGFTAVLASYSESYPEASGQNMDENLTELLSHLLPQNMLEDGNSLPQEDQTVMWQTVMMFQPAENVTTNVQSNQAQTLGLFDNSRKPVINTSILSQNYFNTLVAQNKELTNALPANSVSAQLAAAHFIPDAQESLLLNVNEQLVPIQGVNSTLSQGLSAVGFGTATQAANTQTLMAPLNLGQNAWESNLGSRLQMLVGQNVQT